MWMSKWAFSYWKLIVICGKIETDQFGACNRLNLLCDNQRLFFGKHVVGSEKGRFRETTSDLNPMTLFCIIRRIIGVRTGHNLNGFVE